MRSILQKRSLLGVLTLGFVAPVLLVACAEPSTDDETQGNGDDTATTAAGEPTTITVYTSEPEDKVDEINKAFTEAHPDIEVEVYRAGTGDLTARIEAEKASGGVEADIIWAADAPTFEKFKSDDLLTELDGVNTTAVLEEAVDSEGFYVGTRIIPTVIAYNTEVFGQDEAPQSWQDLTDERFAQQIVMPDPAVSGAAAFNATVWKNNSALGDTWIEALGANSPMIAASNGPTSQEIAGGGHPVGVVVDYLVRDLADAGSPISTVYPSEGAPFITEPIAIFADSDAAEASRKYIEFILSEEGQKLAVEQNYVPVISGVSTPDGVPSLDELSLMEADLSTLTDGRAEAVEFFQNALK